MDLNLVSFLKTISVAKRCEDVFGQLDVSDQLRDCKRLYLRFASLVHEDKHQNSKEDLAIAQEAFRLLAGFWTEAQEKIAKGTYGTKSIKTAPAVIASTKHKYTITEVIAAGDLSTVYGGTDEIGQSIIAKVSRTPVVNVLLAREATVATELLLHVDRPYITFFPHLIESFKIKDKAVRQVNVFEDTRNGPCFPLTEVVANYPKGIDPRHFVWIFKRVLAMLMYTHRRGLVHAAVIPTHIVIRPSDHGMILVDWSYAVPRDGVVSVISPSYRGFYPPEVMAKKPAGPETDLYMAAKCMEYILGGEALDGVPGPFRRLLDSCLIPNPARRMSDAQMVFNQVVESAQAVYGRPKFVDLVLT